MSSGVQVNSKCVPTYEDLKIRHKYRYIVYALTPDLKEIIVQSTGTPDKTYDDFKEELIEAEAKGECRYGVFDAAFELKDGQKRTKILFFYWGPDSAKIKQKMVYSSSKDYIKNALVGISKFIQANDQGDLAWEEIFDTLVKGEAAS